MESKSLFFILLFIFVKAHIQEENYCQKIQCSNELDSGTCIQVEYDTSFFKECPEGEVCNIQFDDPIENTKCIKYTKKFKRLPTLPCETNEDCLSGHCYNKKCVGVYLNEKCNSVTDCIYDLTCRKDIDNIFKCLEPITTGNKCDYDTDCVRESGCMNNVCTNYFSLENNQKSIDFINEELSFCKSGYSDELGICQNLTLISENTECSSENKCVYRTQSGKNITIESNCLCGYNPYGKKYCLLGSGNKNYTKYIDNLKEYYLMNKNCHLSERNAEPCQKDLLSDDLYILKKINELINSKYWAKSNNKLIGAQECVFKVEMPDYDRELDKEYNPEPVPGKGNCAVYKCQKNNAQEFCAMSTFKNAFYINVTLYDICSSGVECKIGGDPNDVFYNRTNINSRCYSKVENMRYPGERCDIDIECIYPLNNPSSQFHKCEDGRCNGMDENGICEDNSWCLAGYYCDKYSGKCKEQKSKNEKCLDSKECQNDLICLYNKCSNKLYSLDNGKEVPQNEDKETQKRFCKSGEVYESICVSYNDIDEKTSDDKYKICNFEDKCVYKIIGLNTQNIMEIPCPCGYNSEGQGYCPHFHEYSTNDWNEYRKILKANYNNECHTENRYDCYNKLNLEEEKQYKNKLEKGHLFYNSVECAKKVLDGNYLLTKKLYMILAPIILF